MRKETTARAAGGIGLSHTEVCAVSEFILVNRGKMDFLVYASEYSTERGKYHRMVFSIDGTQANFFFSAQESILKLPDSVNESNYQN